MREIIRKVPIPTAGVALGLAALGNLLQPYTEIVHIVCGILSLVLIAMLGAKIALFPDMIRDDLHNSIMASVSATLFMTLMQLAGYLAPFAYIPAFALWSAAVVAHLALMGWFTARFISHFKLHEVFPTYFICYVGIVVASVTSPTFGMEAVGHLLFWFGFACYVVLLGLVTYRYMKHEIPESARPLFCIYTALNKETEAKALATIRQVVDQLRREGPTSEELERAREQSKANVVMGLESTQSRMSHAGRSLLFSGEILTPEQIIAAYDSVTHEDVVALAQEIFRWDQVSLSAVGQVRTAEAYRALVLEA